MFQSAFSYIIDLDQTLFLWLNQEGTSHFLDRFMPLFLDLKPYLFILGLVLLTALIRGGKRTRFALLATILLVGLANALSSEIVKPLVGRARPYEALAHVRLYEHGWKHAGYASGRTEKNTISFPSSHAVNNFAAAAFLGFYFPNLRLVLLLFAALVAYSRLYLGVHFPLDVLGGAAMGIILAYVFRLLIRQINRLPLGKRAKAWIIEPIQKDGALRKSRGYYWPGMLLFAAGLWMLRLWAMPEASYDLVVPVALGCLGGGSVMVLVDVVRKRPFWENRVLVGLMVLSIIVFLLLPSVDRPI